MAGAEENKSSQLLADIEAFSLNGPTPSQETSKPEIHRESVSFPDLKKAQAAAKSPAPAVPSSFTTPPSTPAAGRHAEAAPASNLLERLKQQASSIQKDTSQRDTQLEFRAKLITAVMGAAYRYLDDLFKQLNILKPAIPKEYVLPGNIAFAGMSWTEGATDFRMVPSATDDRRYESISTRFRIASPQKLVIDRQTTGIEPVRKSLQDYGVVFTVEEKHNIRNQPESARFTIPCEVKSGFLVKADYEAGNLVLRTRNIDRFGMMEFRLEAQELNQAALDELTHLILGEKSRFMQMFRRSA